MRSGAPAEAGHLRSGVAALAVGVALAVFLASFRPEPVAVVAGLVISRYLVLGLLFARAARLVRAEEAVAGDPTSAELHFELAFARLERGRVGEAVRAFRQGIGLDPELDMDRPAELARRLLLRRDLTPARRKVAGYLVTAALFDRMLEDMEDALPVGGGPGSLSVRDAAARLSGAERDRFLEHCRGLVRSLRVEITGLEQLVVALDGAVVDEPPTDEAAGPELEQQRRAIEREIERLRAHADELDFDVRHAERGRGDSELG
jgi:hypothetical protein